MSGLALLAAQIGAPLVEKALTQRLGGASGQLAADVIRAVAARAGTDPAGIEAMVEAAPPQVIDAIRQVEAMAPELVALYAAGVETQFAALAAEKGEPMWFRAWRPVTMYLFGFLWLWNLVILHVANAVWKIALPASDLTLLLQLNVVYMGLYMGGHTIKDFAARWAERGRAAA